MHHGSLPHDVGHTVGSLVAEHPRRAQVSAWKGSLSTSPEVGTIPTNTELAAGAQATRQLSPTSPSPQQSERTVSVSN